MSFLSMLICLGSSLIRHRCKPVDPGADGRIRGPRYLLAGSLLLNNTMKSRASGIFSSNLGENVLASHASLQRKIKYSIECKLAL